MYSFLMVLKEMSFFFYILFIFTKVSCRSGCTAQHIKSEPLCYELVLHTEAQRLREKFNPEFLMSAE